MLAGLGLSDMQLCFQAKISCFSMTSGVLGVCIGLVWMCG